jgi:ketosteroid isomerase-like protein
VTEGSSAADEVLAWFADYLRAYAACCRGDSDDVAQLLAFYGVPLLLTTDATVLALTGEDQVVDAVRPQIERLRAAGYDRTETLDSETTVLNATTALHRAFMSWLRADGSEIARMRLTYVITHGVNGRRISALVVGTP